MAEAYSNETLGAMVESGFKGVHERLDILNGKANRSEEFRIKNEDFLADLKEEKKQNYERVIDLLWKIGVIAVFIVFGWEKLNG